MRERPWLSCPECGVPLIPAHTRGRVDRDGNFLDHGLDCRCRWCDWFWFDDSRWACECGVVAFADCFDDPARAREVFR